MEFSLRREPKTAQPKARLDGGQRLKECGFILVLAAAVFTMVALLSFDGDLIDKTGKTWSGQNIAFTAAAFGDGVMFTRGSARSRVQSEMHPDFSLGADDFTIEFTAQIDTSYNCTLLDWRSGTSSANPLIESDGGNLYLWLYNEYRIGPFPDVIDPDFLHHFALARESGLARLFLDGVMLGSAAYPESITNTQVTVGANQNVGSTNSSFDLSGVVDELRITKGVARYTENFTPPNAPFPAG